MTKDDTFYSTEFLPYLLNQAAEAASLGFRQYYKERYGMLRTEWRVLFHLGQFGEMTAKDICTRANIHKTKISRAVSALEQKRFIARRTMETDRRLEELFLTKSGKQVLEDLQRRAKAFDRSLMERLGEEDARSLKRNLAILAGLKS